MINLPVVGVDINGKTLVTAASLDEILIADASDSFKLKKVTAQTIANLGGGGGGGIPNPFAAEAQLYKDDFMANSYIVPYGPLSLFGGKTGTSATITRRNLSTGDGHRVGLYLIQSGSTAGYAYMGNAAKCIYPADNEIRTGFNFKLVNTPDVTNDFYTFFGVSDVWSGIGSNMAGLIIDRTVSTTNWVALSRLNNVSTTTDTGIAFSTNYVTIETIINTAATSITYYVDGVLGATHTTNVPLNKGMAYNFRTTWVLGAARSFYIDACYLHFTPGTARGTTYTWPS